mgnify:CR=1 FL=1
MFIGDEKLSIMLDIIRWKLLRFLPEINHSLKFPIAYSNI